MLAVVLMTSVAAGAPAQAAGPRTRHEAIAALGRSGARPQVYVATEGTPYFLRLDPRSGPRVAGANPIQRARGFLASYGAIFGVQDPAAQLRIARTWRDDLGMDHVRFEQVHHGIRVLERTLVVHLRGDRVAVVNGDVAQAIDVDVTPRLSPAQAVTRARASLRKLQTRAPAEAPSLSVFPRAGGHRLAWSVVVPSIAPLGLHRVEVDATDGSILRSFDDLQTARARSTYTNGNDADCNTDTSPSCTLPGTLLRGEADGASGDAHADAVHQHAGATYDYFQSTFGRDSFDGSGHELRSTVHFATNLVNAFYCASACVSTYGGSTAQFVYGDGDGVNSGPLGQALDVVAHEITHGVTDHTAGLIYYGQSGALNESYSDIFAAYIDDADWQMGEDVWTPGVGGDALRDMSDPTIYGDPGHMDDFIVAPGDNAGVHTNSGIPNKAAYLLADDPTYGIGRAASAPIMYRALTVYLTESATFAANLAALIQAASDLHGAGSAQVEAVVRANAAVGLVLPPPITSPDAGSFVAPGSETSIAWNGASNLGLTHVVEHATVVPGTSTEGFESAATPDGVTMSGHVAWSPSTARSYTGSRAFASGAIGSSQWSAFSITRELLSPGTLSYWRNISTEEDFDFFMLFIDGTLEEYGSGETGWARPSFPLSAGTHTITWMYAKDGSVTEGADRVWIDDIAVTQTASPTWVEVGTTAAGVTSQAWTAPATSSTGNRFRVRVPGASTSFGSSISPALGVDADAPNTLALSGSTLSRAFQPSARPSLMWSGRDATSSIVAWDLLRRSAGTTTAFGSSTTVLSRTSATHAQPTLAPGTHCLQVRGYDAVGNSALSPERCTAVPVNERALTRGGTWSGGRHSSAFGGDYLRTTIAGRTLSTTMRVKRLAIIVTTCPTCGKIDVFHGSTKIATLNLYSSSTRYNVALPAKTFTSVRPSAVVRIRTTVAGKLVQIEGFGASQV